MLACCAERKEFHHSTPLVLSFDEALTFFPFQLETCNDGTLSEMMPDIALATESLSRLHHDEPTLELDIGDGSMERQATLYI